MACMQSSPLCMLGSHQYSFTISVSNNPFLALTSMPVSVQVLKGTDFISNVANAVVPVHSPQTVGSPSISRSNLKADQDTNATISFSHTGVSAFTLIIAPLSTPSGTVSLLSTVSSVNLGQSQLTHSLSNGSLHISISNQNTSSTTLVLQGTNSFLIHAGT